MRSIHSRLTALLMTLLALPALASDGVFEINQTCAVQTGCFPGDSPGYPVTLTEFGSYRLTSNLSVTTNASGIQALTINPSVIPNFTLDLGGFEIAGPVTCSGAGAGLDCAGVGGIAVDTTWNATILNGRIRGFAYGIGTVANLIAHHVEVMHNSTYGILSSSSGVVKESIIRENGVGIEGFLTHTLNVEECVITGNRGNGLSAGGRVIRGNHVSGNGGIGISTNRSVVRDNVVTNNALDGIAATNGTLVIDNSSIGNGQAGILARSGSSVQRNTVQANGTFGLNLPVTAGATSAVFKDNVISGNTGGTVSGGINLGSNSCNGLTTCP